MAKKLVSLAVEDGNLQAFKEIGDSYNLDTKAITEAWDLRYHYEGSSTAMMEQLFERFLSVIEML